MRECIFTAKNNEQRLPNLSKILRKSTPGPSLGPLLDPLWSLLGSILGTCSQKTGFWRRWGGSWESKTANLAPIPCASRVPPRYKGKRKAQVNANMGFLQQFMQPLMRYVSASSRASKKHREISPRSLNIAPRTLPEAFKIHPGASPRAKMRPKTSQKAPKSGQEAPKMCPRGA